MNAGVTRYKPSPQKMHGTCPGLSSVLQNFSNFLVRIPFEAVITTALGNFCKMIFEAKKNIFLQKWDA